MTKHSKPQQTAIIVWGKIMSIAAEAGIPLVLIWLFGDPGDMGVYATIMLVYKTLLKVFTTGFPRATLYFFGGRTQAEKRELSTKLTAVLIGLGGAMGLLLVVIGLLGHGALAAISSAIQGLVGSRGAEGEGLLVALDYLPWLAPYAVFDLTSRILPQVLISEERPRAAAAIPLLRSTTTLLGTLLPVLLGFGLTGIVIGLNLSGVICFVVYLWFMIRLYGRARPTRGRIRVRELFAYALPLGLTNVVSDLNKNLDMWLIIAVYLATREEVAVYRMGAWQIPIITTIAYTVGSVYLAQFKSLHLAERGAEAIRIWRRLIRKVSLIVVPASAVFVVAAEEFTAVAFPDAYAGAAPVFRAYCFLTMARVSAYGNALVAAGRPRDVVKASIWTLVSNALLSVPLVLVLGFLGPAVGTAIAIIPATGIYCLYIARAYGVRWRDTFPLTSYAGVVLIAAVPCALAVLFKLTVSWPPLAMFAVEALIVLVGFSLLATVLGRIDGDDWRFVRDCLTFRVAGGSKAA
jgi:O-antigen/teichoic acid export membrane protein